MNLVKEQEFVSPKLNSPNNDIYQTQGYRLPTEAEYEYMLRNLGESHRDFPHGISMGKLKDYAWFEKNSGDQTHRVGTTLESFLVNGHNFHDLIGNVWSWTFDWNDDLQPSCRILRGGSWIDGSADNSLGIKRCQTYCINRAYPICVSLAKTKWRRHWPRFRLRVSRYSQVLGSQACALPRHVKLTEL